MRILIVCPCPIERELGAAQVHLNLADALRARGHDVVVWTPLPLPQGSHWSTSVSRMRVKLLSVLQREKAFDVVDCPPAVVSPPVVGERLRWVARTTQPDASYLWEAVRGGLGISPQAMMRTAVDGAWCAYVTAAIYRGMSRAHVIVCHSAGEQARIGARFPWLRSKVHAYEGAISEGDRASLAQVRKARRPSTPGRSVRYLWIGRWARQKGVDALTSFLRSRLARPTEDVFTIAGCGKEGERAVAAFRESGHVHVVPSFSRSELPELLANHDAGLFTSRVEGWGLVLHEMVESGLPVYATRAGGVDEIRSVLGPFIPQFPPPLHASLPPFPSVDVLARYDARFCWQAVADRYLAALGPDAAFP